MDVEELSKADPLTLTLKERMILNMSKDKIDSPKDLNETKTQGIPTPRLMPDDNSSATFNP